MENWLNNYFGVTKREYNGLLVFMAIILLLTVGPHLYERFLVKPKAVTVKDKEAVKELISIEERSPLQNSRYSRGNQYGELKMASVYEKFDPNNATLRQWQQFGLSHKQANAILNYINKGGRFYDPKDLKKMYTISPEKYAQLEPYIEIVGTNRQSPVPRSSYPLVKRAELLIELNAADTVALDKLKGIGSAFAKRIVKYRDRLGGFCSKEQLLEVYGLDSAKYLEIVNQVSVDLSLIKKIEINTASLEQLKTHPYLKFKQINAILQYRKQHGSFGSIDDLKKVLILTPQTIQSLAPYLLF